MSEDQVMYNSSNSKFPFLSLFVEISEEMEAEVRWREAWREVCNSIENIIFTWKHSKVVFTCRYEINEQTGIQGIDEF